MADLDWFLSMFPDPAEDPDLCVDLLALAARSGLLLDFHNSVTDGRWVAAVVSDEELSERVSFWAMSRPAEAPGWAALVTKAVPDRAPYRRRRRVPKDVEA